MYVAPALAVAVLAISFAALFFKQAAPTHPLVVAGGRLCIASLLLAPFTIRGARAGRLPRAVLRSAAVCGLLYAVHFGTWVASLRLTSVAASVTLVTATPLLLAAVALVTGRDRPDRRHFVSIALALIGLGLIGGADLASGDALLGDGLALAGAAAMAVYLLIVRRHGSELDPWAFLGVATAIGAVTLLGAALLTGAPLAFASTESFVFVLLSALVPQLVGHTLITWSLRHTRPTVVGIATVGEPVGSTVLAWWWLAEVPRAQTLLGCTVTVAAVILAVWQPRRPA